MKTEEKSQIAKRPVKILSSTVARKIAAGEVIDRPASIVRELLDNALDSGADEIFVEIFGGGIEKIRVLDNGFGFSEEDLKICATSHATSKISSADDLLRLTTLGFRGEALSSMAAVSNLTIFSGQKKMSISAQNERKIEEIANVQNGCGSIIQTENLFSDFPARRVFLKRPSSEANLCKEIFIEKSLPQKDVSFRFSTENQIKLDLPKTKNLASRFVSALELKKSPELFFEISGESEEREENNPIWKFKILLGEPSIFRNDRKQIFIFANKRKIQEFALVQALEYGTLGFFPNGTHPVAAIFIEINPAYIDFNIHPAKKEARFKDLSSIHKGISFSVKNFLKTKIQNNFSKPINFSDYAVKSRTFGGDFLSKNYDSPQKNFDFLQKKLVADIFLSDFNDEKDFKKDIFSDSQKNRKIYDTKKQIFENSQNFSAFNLDFEDLEKSKEAQNHEFEKNSENDLKIETKNAIKSCENSCEFFPEDFCYIGSAFSLFLICEFRGEIFFIDRHAAHERILFDEMCAQKKHIQKLLFPLEIESENTSDDEYLKSILEPLKNAGFFLEQKNEKWLLTSVPEGFEKNEIEIAKKIIKNKIPPQELVREITAERACKKAIKDGGVLDRKTAEELAKKALTLSDPHCPHGRPIWTIFSKEELFSRVRRTR